MRFPPSLLLYLFFSSLHTFHAHRSASRFTYRILTILPTLHFSILTSLAIPILLWKGRPRWIEWRIPCALGVLFALLRHAELVTGVEEVEIGLIVALRVILFPPLFQFINGTFTNAVQLRLQSLISLLFSITALFLSSSACSLAGFFRWTIFGTLCEFMIIMLEREWVRNGAGSNCGGGGRSWWELLAKSAPVALVVSCLFTYPYINRDAPTDPDYLFLVNGGAFWYNNWWYTGVAAAYGVTASLDTLTFFYLMSTPTLTHSAEGTFNFLTVGSLFRMVVQLALDQQVVGRLGWMGGGRSIGRGQGNSEVWCVMIVLAFLFTWAASNGWIWKDGDVNSVWSPQEEKKSQHAAIPLHAHSKTYSNDFPPFREENQKRNSLPLSSGSVTNQAGVQVTKYLYLSLVPFLLFVLMLFHPVSPSSSPRSLDIVMSYFDEPLHKLLITMQTFYSSRAFVDRSPRLILYVKNEELANDAQRVKKLKEDTGADHVVTGLKNMGRESGTYLNHILINYNTTREEAEVTKDAMCDNISCPVGLATHTHFVQAHLSWERLAVTRFELLETEDHTGFMTGTVWLTSDCGKDGRGNGDFPRMTQIYTMFREEPCPPTMQLATYSGQFFVSRKRILENKYSAYKELDDLLEAPPGSSIYQEGDFWNYHGDMGPSNPYFGHAVERSWPTIFNCIEPSIAERCYDSDWVARRKDCQCYDREL